MDSFIMKSGSAAGEGKQGGGGGLPEWKNRTSERLQASKEFGGSLGNPKSLGACPPGAGFRGDSLAGGFFLGLGWVQVPCGARRGARRCPRSWVRVAAGFQK